MPEQRDGTLRAETAKATAATPAATITADAILRAETAEATAEAPPATFLVSAYQILSQLSAEERKQLLNDLKAALNETQPATPEPQKYTLSGQAYADQVTGTGPGLTTTAPAVITNTLPQPQAKQLTDLITNSTNLIRAVYYLISILEALSQGELPANINKIVATIIERAEQLLAKHGQ